MNQESNLPSWVAQVNEFALGWYTALRRPDEAINVYRPPTAGITFGPTGVSTTIDPNTLLIGAVAIVAVIFLLKS